MDQKITGKFIAELRRERGLTQKELADKLLLSDKTVSKWEQGRGFPDVSLLLPLCEILEVTVNELLSGKRLQADEYQKNAEKNMVRLMQDKKEFKLKIFLEVMVLLLTLVSGISLCMVASYVEMPNVWRVWIIVLALVIIAIGVAIMIVLERMTFAYRCSICNTAFVPTYGAYICGMHTMTKRFLKCPKCGQRNWCKLCNIAEVALQNTLENQEEKTQD